MVEVSWDEGLGAVQVTLPLPYDSGNADYYVKAFKASSFILASLSGAIFEYDLDLGIPGYPMLRARASFPGFEALSRSLIETLSSYLRMQPI